MKALSHECKIISEATAKPNYVFKIVLLGNSNVGKTCLAQKIKNDTFQETKTITVGFDSINMNFEIDAKEIVNLKLWDTCGQERYNSLIPSFYDKSSLAIIMFAINNRQSFDEVSKWVKSLRNNASPDCKMILIGGKSDLENEREVTYDEGQKSHLDYQCEFFMETSSKSGLNVENLFKRIVCILYDALVERVSTNESESSKDIIKELQETNGNKKEKQRKCC